MASLMSGPRRILVVDDNLDSAELLAEVLTLKGFDVSVAHSPTEALALIATLSPEVALIDIALPEMTGYELARRIRQSATTCRLIAVTGYADFGARARSLDAGFDAHLVKPVRVEEVRTAIDYDP